MWKNLTEHEKAREGAVLSQHLYVVAEWSLQRGCVELCLWSRVLESASWVQFWH